MHFVNPAFLFGLFAISIPIVIHLFNFRRFRKVYFTNVRFIKQLKQETQKRSQLRHLIILLMRILAITALVLAFAQPYIPHSPDNNTIAAKNDISVFVDNSFSMEAVGSNGTLLDEAKQKAKEIVAAYKASDNFQLLTNDFEGRHQRFMTRDEFLTLLEEVKPSPSSRKIAELLSRQQDVFTERNTDRKNAFIISDFQKSSYKEMGSVSDTALNVYFVPVNANIQSNVFIDSCWFDLPLQQVGQATILNTRIINKSGKDLEKIPVKLDIDGRQRAVASIDLKAGASGNLRIPFNNPAAGLHYGIVQIVDYPLTYDDQFFFSFNVTSSLSVLSINGKDENKFINTLFSQDSTLLLTNILEKTLDYAKLSSYSLIILNELPAFSTGLMQELSRFIQNGGSIAIIPAASPDLNSYNSFLSSLKCPSYLALDTVNTMVTRLNQDHPVYRDVFETSAGVKSLPENTEMPSVSKHFPIVTSSANATQSLMKMLNGRDFLTVTQTFSGQVFQFATSLNSDFSNFPKQALFVPTLYNIALISRPPMKLSYTIGRNDAIHLNMAFLDGDNVFKIRSWNGKFEMIPEQKRAGSSSDIFINDQVKVAGHYLLINQSDTISAIAFNYNRDESNPECMSNDEIEASFSRIGPASFNLLKSAHKPLNEVIEEMNFGTRLWKYFVLAALVFLLAEILLLRFWRK